MANRDDDEFERAMRMMDVKPSEKKKRPGKEPAGPEVIEDVDFEAAMRELPDGRPVVAAKKGADAGARAGADPGARTEQVATAKTYAATEQESAEFLAAMESVRPPSAARESTTRVVGSPDVEALTRRIGRGQLEPDASLDLHGKTRQQALELVKRFVGESRSEKWRVVRVVVGKGLHSEGGDAVVGPAVERYLRDGPALEVLKAPAHLGGGGALIAILRLE